MMSCPMKDKDYSGNCESCNERVDCMLRDIMQKLVKLEAAVAGAKTK